MKITPEMKRADDAIGHNVSNTESVRRTKMTKCPNCGCKENESQGNDFHCKDCSYLECAEEK